MLNYLENYILSWILWIENRELERDSEQRLKYLRAMDRLDRIIDRLHREITKTKKIRKFNESRYWEDKWNEAVHLHMEMTWEIHPDRHLYGD